MSQACTCTNGRTGAQICKADHTFGACVCDGEGDASAVDAALDTAPPNDAHPDAGSPDAVDTTDVSTMPDAVADAPTPDVPDAAAPDDVLDAADVLDASDASDAASTPDVPDAAPLPSCPDARPTESGLPSCDVEIMGTFTMSATSGTPLAGSGSLVPIVGDTNHWWICLQGVTEAHLMQSRGPGMNEYDTTLQATGFTFRFTGPDAALLNAQVGSHFSQGGFGGGYFQLSAIQMFGVTNDRSTFYIWPPDTSTGVYFQVGPMNATLATDASGYPVFTSAMLLSNQSVLFDHRPGSDGNIYSVAAECVAVADHRPGH